MELQLMHGVWRTGRCHRDVHIRPLSGRDEAFLLERPATWPTAHRTSALLQRLVERVEGLDEPLAGMVREFSIGDREHLLTTVCRQLLGDRIDLVARCGDADCGDLTEISLSLDDLIAAEPQDPVRETHELMCTGPRDQRLRVAFRLPDGALEEQAGMLAMHHPAAAANLIFESIVVEITDHTGDPVDPASVLPSVRMAMETALQELDPVLDRHTRISCRACGRSLVAEFDAMTVLMNAITSGGDIFRQVDRIARAYHWTEADILSLTAARRQVYLRLVEPEGSVS